MYKIVFMRSTLSANLLKSLITRRAFYDQAFYFTKFLRLFSLVQLALFHELLRLQEKQHIYFADIKSLQL